jgi:uncharacterized membrane protein HdeD (DUF308 family)
MSSATPLREAIRHDLTAIRSRWVPLAILGALTVVLGVVALGTPLVATLATVTFLSVLLIVAGVAGIIGAFWVKEWSGFFLQLLTDVLYVAVGILTLNRPLEFALSLTLLIAALLIGGGLFKIIAAIAVRCDQWIWLALHGVLSLLLGIMIWSQWPYAASWVIGTFLGIEMIMSGWTWIMIALRLKQLPRLEGR